MGIAKEYFDTSTSTRVVRNVYHFCCQEHEWDDCCHQEEGYSEVQVFLCLYDHRGHPGDEAEEGFLSAGHNQANIGNFQHCPQCSVDYQDNQEDDRRWQASPRCPSRT